MPFTAQELASIEASVIDFHKKGVTDQTLQVRPLYDDLIKMKETFPGGKEYVTMRVSGEFPVEMVGYTHDDEQAYDNPATLKEAKAKWYEVGAGISTTLTELKKYGITVVDSAFGDKTSTHSDAELVALVKIIEYKLNQLNEGSARSLAEMFWRDGSQDAKAIPGVLSFITTTPTTGTTFGIDRAVNTWWRHRTSLGIDSSTASNQNLVNTLQDEFRQLRRYGTPKHKFYAGSDFMDAFEKELRSKGNYTLEGWASTKRIDASIADLAFKGVDIVYEPLLDDLSLEKHGFVLDMNSIKLHAMDNEWMKDHTPARPPEKYVMYRAKTCTGALCASQLNSSGRYSIA
jgi:hypothetical protein